MAAHRYWRLYVTSSNGGASVRVGEMELRVAADGSGTNVALLSNGGTATTNSDFGGAEVANAFDGNITTNWGNGGAGMPSWATRDFGSGNAYDINHLTIKMPANADSLSSPLGGVLQWSDDNSTWTSHITVTDVGTGSGAIGAFSIPGSANSSLVCPSPTLLSFSGCTAYLVSPMAQGASYGGANSQTACPLPVTFCASGPIVSLTMPSASLYATGHDSTGEQAAYLSMPSPTLFVSTGANASGVLSSPMLTAAGTVTALGVVAAQIPTPTLVAAGTVSGMSNAALRAPIATLVGYSGAVCSVTLTGSPTLAATGTTGSIGGAQLTCPLFELTASATTQNHGSANLIAPSPEMGRTAQAWLIAPGAQLTAIGHAVVTASYEAYATNLKHTDPNANDEVTHYTNFPFTHVVRYQNSYYGANSSGLYLLEGTTDDTAPITWSVKTATTDFKSQQNKTVASAYFGGRLGPAETVTLYAGDGSQENVYNYTTPRDGLAQNHRQVFGKGVKKRYYSLGLSGTGKFELDNIELDVRLTSRKI